TLEERQLARDRLFPDLPLVDGVVFAGEADQLAPGRIPRGLDRRCRRSDRVLVADDDQEGTFDASRRPDRAVARKPQRDPGGNLIWPGYAGGVEDLQPG